MSLLIVGLGNPGKEYVNTRHNAGFLALDALAGALQESWKLNKSAKAEVIETRYFDKKIILAKPQTFMNLSGQSVTSLANKFGIDPQNVWVVSDDVALPLGTLRVRKGGSAGGHNGLKSIMEKLGTDEFVRFRIGVNEPPANIPLENYVLQKFSKAESGSLKNILAKTQETLLHALANGVEDTSVQA
ncbi:MAG: peptidyl-tRNA hydrolase, family [Patescibacteria group bacterium]|jgi:PTH1 family peptidyl-tRNA hydrolase|nr:peptidyl-tRNA hydrolase, family [Patescibacteria group bacterium]